ncbi:UNVERIFIED_CONTAM: hypothetical protein GTU68_023059 [Idotea baltica]|nr:hypothetical protein [Idotea baltica]
MNDSFFANKCAIVTGAGEGIGREVVLQLASQGASIILNDIRADSAHDVVEEIVNKGGKAVAVVGNSADSNVIDQLISTAVSHFGKVDFVIANAGITTFGSFLTYTESQFRELIDVNLFGSFFLAQAASKHMIEQKTEGKILFMSSVTGHQAHPNLAAYGMTKAALEMLAKQLSVELSQHHINVNAIAPGATITPRTEALQDDFKETWERITPLGRVSTTNDIAKCALFLLSDSARQITGQTIIVDGGWTSVSPPPN